METIYFIIEQPYNNYVKIGKTNKHVTKRLSQLQTGNPNHLNVLFTISRDKNMKVETLLHFIFDEFRVNGEWFLMEQDKLLKLKKIFEGNVDIDILSDWIDKNSTKIKSIIKRDVDNFEEIFSDLHIFDKINYMCQIGIFDEKLKNKYCDK